MNDTTKPISWIPASRSSDAHLLFRVSVPEGEECARLVNGAGLRCGRLVAAHGTTEIHYRCDLHRVSVEHHRCAGMVQIFKARQCLAMRSAP